MHKKPSASAKKQKPSRILKFNDAASKPGKLTSQALALLLGDDAPTTIRRLDNGLSALADAPNALLIEALKDFDGDKTVSPAVVREVLLAYCNYIPVHSFPHLSSTSTVRVIYLYIYIYICMKCLALCVWLVAGTCACFFLHQYTKKVLFSSRAALYTPIPTPTPLNTRATRGRSASSERSWVSRAFWVPAPAVYRAGRR